MHKDLELNNKFSWQSVLEMLHTLCGGAADLSFDSRIWEGNRIPTLEVRLDNPAALTEPEVTECDGARLERWGGHVIALCKEQAPNALPDANVWLMREEGNAALIYRAFKEIVRILRAVGMPAEFAWSSMPLVPVCDDLERTLEREKQAFAARAIHTLWIRCNDDEALKKALAGLPACGLLRVQNMHTANTWVKQA